MRSLLLLPGHPESSVSLAVAENPDNAAGLNQEPSIHHSGLDALDRRNSDYPIESRRIGRDTIMSSA
jgi:hypothetical protein